MAENAEDLIFFIEDDYLFEPNCIEEMIFTYSRLSTLFKNDLAKIRDPNLVYLKKAEKMYLDKYDVKYTQTDLAEQFKKSGIKAMGQKSYRLKDVVQCFNNLGFIESSYSGEEIKNGREATELAKSLDFKGINFTEVKEMRDIEKYNEVDCRVLSELTDFIMDL